MGLPTRKPEVSAENQVFIIVKHELVFRADGQGEVEENAQLQLGVFVSPADAQKLLAKLNDALWRTKRGEFSARQQLELRNYRKMQKIEPERYPSNVPNDEIAFKYTQTASDTDRAKNYYCLVNCNLHGGSVTVQDAPVNEKTKVRQSKRRSLLPPRLAARA